MCRLAQRIFVLVLLYKSSQAMKCYQCISSKDPNCNMAPLNSSYLRHCPKTHNFCRKIVSINYFTGDSQTIVTRECAASVKKVEGSCYRGKYSQDSKQLICECKSPDSCNSSGFTEFNRFSIGAMLIVGHLAVITR